MGLGRLCWSALPNQVELNTLRHEFRKMSADAKTRYAAHTCYMFIFLFWHSDPPDYTPKPQFGAETCSVLSSATKFHGLWVYKEFGAHSAWLLCKAMTQRNLKFYMPLWEEMKLLTCLVGMWGALMR